MTSTGPSEEVRLRAAVESSPSGLLVIDARGMIVLVNRETERLFGYDRTELLGQPIEVLVPERYRSHHPGFRAGFVASPQARAMGAGRDLHGVRKDGSEFPVEIGLTPVDTDEGLYVISAIVDISARKAAEAEQQRLEEELRQSQKLEAVGRLAGGIAHDFNNILGLIVGFAELARERHGDRPDLVSDLDEILASATRGRDLVQRILRFSRRHQVSLHPINLREVVEEIAALLRSTLPGNVRIDLAVESDLPRVLGDSVSIHQVLMNLANNAVDAMPNGGAVQIRMDRFYARDSFVRSHPGLQEGHYVRIDVQDEGSGMDAATRERAFEPFFTTKPPGKGTGLGLSMVHGIMLNLGGTVILDSAPGQGTTVSCLLKVSEGALLDEAGPVDPGGGALGELVMLVDDEPGLLRVNTRRLTALGYRVTAHQGPAEALAALQRGSVRPDLIVTDYSMPGMTGVQLAERLKELVPDAPILLFTGHLEGLDEVELSEYGIHATLTKPVTAAEFKEAVQSALESRHR